MSDFQLTLRTEVQPFKGNNEWHSVQLERSVPVVQTAILLCDLWDKHWCKSATRRFDQIAIRTNDVVAISRQKGAQIIHAPSGTMDVYQGFEQRQMMQKLKHVKMPIPQDLPDPPQPIDASDGGCDDEPQCRTYSAWKRQHPAIEIGREDGISNNGQEVYNLLQSKGIKILLIIGVATNMCILGRAFAVKPMTCLGIDCVLVRDLTDAMYNPRMAPYVSHQAGTKLAIQYIEKYWCPTVLSLDLM